jgi:hypothetical protein
MALAMARENPGKAPKKAIGAEWAPIAVLQAESRVFSRAAPIPGTRVSVKYATCSSSI